MKIMYGWVKRNRRLWTTNIDDHLLLNTIETISIWVQENRTSSLLWFKDVLFCNLHKIPEVLTVCKVYVQAGYNKTSNTILIILMIYSGSKWSYFYGFFLYFLPLFLIHVSHVHNLFIWFLKQKIMLGGTSKYLEHGGKVHKNNCRDCWQNTFTSKIRVWSEYS